MTTVCCSQGRSSPCRFCISSTLRGGFGKVLRCDYLDGWESGLQLHEPFSLEAYGDDAPGHLLMKLNYIPNYVDYVKRLPFFTQTVCFDHPEEAKHFAEMLISILMYFSGCLTNS